MGLTAEIELSLRDTGLIDFYEKHEEAFAEMFAASHAFVSGYVASVHLPVRRDDVAVNLVSPLMTNETMREFMGEHKLRQKYWYQRFADLICDRQWEEEQPNDQG